MRPPVTEERSGRNETKAWRGHETYGLGRTPEEVRKTYFTVAEQLDEKPVDGIDGRLFRLATFAALFAKKYGVTAQAWQSVRDGDGAAVSQLAAAAAPSPMDNACALNTTTSFLVDGKLPQRDMSCK